ncbi:MAG: hypothetical protein KF898_01590 [Parachlamydiales bacterium]|nr:hypothetical protein [Verrucomicrobiota bacterium]MBX3718323.1 hypothetical protein [Candidatus Acheromyda pituitae]
MLRFLQVLILYVMLLPIKGSCEEPAEAAASAKRICILTSCWGPMFAIDNPSYNRDNCLQVYYDLRQEAAKQGYHIEQLFSLNEIGKCDLLVVFDVFPEHFAQLSKVPKEKRILFLWEPPSTVPHNNNLEYHGYFSKIYTWDDSLVDNKNYFKFYYPVLRQMDGSTDFAVKKFSSMIACNKTSSHPFELYSERLKVIQYFEGNAEGLFDLYGKWWPDWFRNYRGPVATKYDVLKNYKFSFAYENIRDIPGYITEKIFDCFHAGTVPIYWGASNVEAYIPKNCFIDREDFPTHSELVKYLLAMDEPQYQQYLQHIRDFLESDAAKLYSSEKFIQTFMDMVKSECK